MTKFIRSAFFPILIMVILAMVIQWVFRGDDRRAAPKREYSAPGMASLQILENDLQSGVVRSLVIDSKSSAAKVSHTADVLYYVTDLTDPSALALQIGDEHPEVLVSSGPVTPPKSVTPSFTDDVINGRVARAVMNVKDQMLQVTLKPHGDAGEQTYSLAYTDPATTTQLLSQYQVPYNATSPKSAWWVSGLTFILPFLLILGFWFFIMNQMQGGGSKVMSFGKSRAKRVSIDSPKVAFKDVAGADEAVEELYEIKEFLESPRKFQQLGARIPKGVLLYGPPGTGKTLLARAVAGEAGVPFFSISGSDFVEMFVGVGASRVRDLFEQAKQNAPCIIFVDEIDAVGRHRGAGMGGGHDEREQTLNQLLVEMDGFEMKDNIILIAATNRPDILDPALLRPGRFDRQIVVDRPDRPGRRAILQVHSRGKPISKDLDLDALAAQTPGFTGADLANLINEAALLAARHGKKVIEMNELEEGIMRVLAGPEKKSRLISEKEKAITAYHEMGHALVAHFLEHTDPVHKISVVSRGQALGFTISLPTEDKFLTTRQELMDTLAMTLGGRAAEEVVFGEMTTGAANDLEKVTATAKQMVMRYGMSEELGPRTLGHDQSMPFLGREYQQQADYSEEVAKLIDSEIHRIIADAHQRARDLLIEKRETLDRIARILMERETIEASEFEALVDGVSEEEAFRKRDERAAQQHERAHRDRDSRERHAQPPVPKPAHISPLGGGSV